jgi:ankyrin repeat protein
LNVKIKVKKWKNFLIYISKKPEDRQLFKELSKDGKGNLREVKQFLQEGANVNVKNKDGLNALHLAIRNKHFTCIPAILDANVDITAKISP